MIEIKEKDFESFFQTPFEVYPKDFPFISQLKSDLKRFLSMKNPLFRTEKDFSYFTAFKDGKIAGRILTHIHHASNEKYGWNRSYYGFFECINDVEVAKALLAKAEEFGRSHGCNEVIGNFNMTAMQMIGVITKIHKNYHYTDQVFSPEYIAKLLEKCGYEATFPMVTHEVNVEAFNPETLLGPKQKEIMANPKYTFEKLQSDNLEKVMEAMRQCLNHGFSENPMFVPLTKEEIYFQAKDMMMIIDKETSVIANYEGKAVGVLICIPNLNPFLKAIHSRFGITTPWHFLRHKMNRESATIIFYSVYKEFQSQGLNGVMLYDIMSALKRRGYKRFGGTWISLDNKASLRQAEKLNAEVMHELCLYRKAI